MIALKLQVRYYNALNDPRSVAKEFREKIHVPALKTHVWHDGVLGRIRSVALLSRKVDVPLPMRNSLGLEPCRLPSWCCQALLSRA